MWRVVWCLCVVLGSRVAAADATKDAAFESRLRAELQQVSADAATAWDQANAARDGKRAADAEAGYRRVIALAPGIDHPHRRLCGVLVAVGRADEAVRECETALSLAPSSGYDKSQLAEALAARDGAGDLDRAAKLAREATLALPGDTYAWSIDCLLRAQRANAIDVDAVDDVSVCADHLLALDPMNLAGNSVASGVAYYRGDYTHASIYLERAKDAGMPPAQYARLRSKLDKARERAEPATLDVDETLAIGVPLVGGWILLLLLLLVIGNVLSDSTLRTLEHGAVEDGTGTPRQRRTRRIYRVVLLVCGLLFYASLPLMVGAVIFGALVVVDTFDAMGATPIFVLLLVGGAVFTTVAAVWRALFPGRRPAIDGTAIDLAAYPKLAALLGEIADAIGTRRVDLVYLSPGADVGVMEQGSLWRSLLGLRCERILVLGVGLFDGMKQGELRSILAHEHGHFRNDDVGGGHILSVQRSLGALTARMARGGWFMRFNPAWWFVRAYTHLYLVVSRGASRLQEALADRWAIRAYGSEAFIAGERHVVAREVELAADLAQTIKDVVDNKWSLPNFYAYAPERAPKRIEASIAKRMDRVPTRFDSHPSPHQRIDLAARLAMPGDHVPADAGEPVWTLFHDPEKIERDMTAVLRERVRRRMGVTISGEEWEDDEPPDTGDRAPGAAG